MVGLGLCEGWLVEIYPKVPLVLRSFSPLSSQGPPDPQDYLRAGHDHLSSGEPRLPTPKDPEHEVVCITDLFENKPKAATEGGLTFCVGNGQKPLKMMPWMHTWWFTKEVVIYVNKAHYNWINRSEFFVYCVSMCVCYKLWCQSLFSPPPLTYL